MTIREYDQYQCSFKVDNPLNSIPKDHPCFIVDAVVESLDFSEFESKHGDTAGMPMYHRKLLLKLDLMGTIDGVLSSRKICQQTLYNDVYRFLAGNHEPNFRTLCISRDENDEMYEKALLSIVIIGKKLGIVTLKHISTDGSYFKGDASVNNLFTKDDVKILEELIQRRMDIDMAENLLYGDENYGIVEEDYYNAVQELINQDIIDNTLKDIKNEITDESVNDSIDTIKEEIKRPKLSKITKKIKKVAKKAIKGDEKTLEKIEVVKKKLDEGWQDKVNMTDPDTFAGKNKKGVYESVYNIIFACDSDSKFVLATLNSDSFVDTNQLIPMLEKLKSMDLITENTIVSADSIFNTGEALEFLEKERIKGLVPDKYEASVKKNEDYEAENKYHKHNFTFNFKNDSYTCPEGRILPFKNQYKDGRKVYYNNECKNCPAKKKCSKNQNTRVISAYPGEQARQRMKIEMEKPENKEEYKKRSSTAESPLGDIKHNNKIREFTVRGGEKVYVESLKFSFSHNARILVKTLSEQGLNIRKTIENIAEEIKNTLILNIFSKNYLKTLIVILN